MKYNNTSFTKDACKNMSFSKFKELYSVLLKGCDLEKVFAELGGTMPKKATKKVKEDGGD